MAKLARWENVTIAYNMASKNKEDQQVSLGPQILISYIGAMFILTCFGTIVNLTKLGDIG